MATELELLYEKTLKTLLEQQETERVKLSKELESLRAENALIIQQYNEISEQLTTLQSLINSLKR
ncbi:MULTISPECIES: hypothetical protein [Pasteurellaceae]|uniref:MobD n=3 Tax=Pasteurellaceae TaxID=712 RepID=B3H358_ACTP7|nr:MULTISPECIES: hypothetical protein [Pasteurellaceae]ACE62793.1 hypothetical protein APP7_A0004 [Actinobacillus pleuropneumoniae serovar 7 str. AP76]MCT8807916.1 hypothetical protein [Glaesserella parasuis]OFN32852.1 hypothetical protein HMPREF2600_00035 [Neisseria sp. HMSC077D05]EFN01671.1 hypothetical protein appser13_21430 [Actinobacillus pleuropneumoniae serovar 13 str. N273]MDO9732505.1 hypothetical protein [Glaesserella parasuis]